MKIRCIKLVDGFGKDAIHSQWEKVGAVYDVLSLEIGLDGRSLVRFVGDRENIPALRPLEQFEIVDHSIPTVVEIRHRFIGKGRITEMKSAGHDE